MVGNEDSYIDCQGIMLTEIWKVNRELLLKAMFHVKQNKMKFGDSSGNDAEVTCETGSN